jgi:uncharacterized alkaline shock family protein YloU
MVKSPRGCPRSEDQFRFSSTTILTLRLPYPARAVQPVRSSQCSAVRAGLYNALMATKRTPEPNALEVEISRDVLVGISSIALEGIRGVTPVTPPVNVGEILAGKRLKGINVTREGAAVTVDISVNVDYGLAIPDVARKVQRVVAENVEVMTGLSVKAVNVTVQSVVLPASETLEASHESHA